MSSPYSTSRYVLPFGIVIFCGWNENVSVVSFRTDLSNVHTGLYSTPFFFLFTWNSCNAKPRPSTSVFGSVNCALAQPSKLKSAFGSSCTIISATVSSVFVGMCTIFGASFGGACAVSVIDAGVGVGLGDAEADALAPGDADPSAAGVGVGVGVGVGEGLGEGDGVAVAFDLAFADFADFGDSEGAGVGAGRLKLSVHAYPSAICGHAKPFCASAMGYVALPTAPGLGDGDAEPPIGMPFLSIGGSGVF